jgi:hypothetical protein
MEGQVLVSSVEKVHRLVTCNLLAVCSLTMMKQQTVLHFITKVKGNGTRQ